jgi:DNA polymerase III delta prime subunit
LGAVADRFGIERESRIIESGVRDVFTPHKPVNEVDLLFGRDDEVRSLIEHMNTPGQHCLLYGERGVGKSSLANVVGPILAGLLNGELMVKRCDSSDCFETIIEAPLKAVGIDLLLAEASSEESSASSVGGSLRIVEAKRNRQRAIRTTYRRPPAVSPAKAAEELRPLGALLVIDEADAIRDSADRHKLAEFIKHLSDSGASLKVLIVGIAETGQELMAAHPSVARCLSETKLGRMTESELREIVEGGASRVGLTFERDATDAIVACSAGYPHFTHLMALKCSENAIATSRSRITKNDVIEAMDAARADAEGSLKESYDAACRSYNTDMYRIVLVAAASIDAQEFSAEELRKAISTVTGEYISQGALNNYFQRLVGPTPDTILRRMAKGVYRFADPRMPSYVRIANKMV